MFKQHWCNSKSRWPYKAVDVGRCPHLYTGSFRARLVCLFQTGNPTSALCGFLAALMAVIWSLSVCGGTFAYIHPRIACTIFLGFLFLTWRTLGLFQMTVLSEGPMTCKKESLLIAVKWYNSHAPFAVLRSTGSPAGCQVQSLTVTTMILLKKRSGSPQIRSIIRDIVFCILDIRLRAQSSSSSHWLCPQWMEKPWVFRVYTPGNVPRSCVPHSTETEVILIHRSVLSQIWLKLSLFMQGHLLFSFPLPKLVCYEENME